MTASSSIWLTRGAVIDSEEPLANLMTGMARCIRAENPSVTLTTLDFDFGQPITSTANVKFLKQILASATNSMNHAHPEWEYAIRDNKVHVQRILLENGMNDLLSTFLTQAKAELAPFKQSEWPLSLQIGTPGRLDTLHFNDDPSFSDALSPTDVEIAVKAVGLNFKDIMISMGQTQSHALGLDCSGVVSRVGSEVKNIKPGDRVMT